MPKNERKQVLRISLGTGCRRFEPCHSDQKFLSDKLGNFYLLSLKKFCMCRLRRLILYRHIIFTHNLKTKRNGSRHSFSYLFKSEYFFYDFDCAGVFFIFAAVLFIFNHIFDFGLGGFGCIGKFIIVFFDNLLFIL